MKATGRGDCSGKSERGKIWKTAETVTGEFSSGISAMEIRKNNGNSGSKGMWDAAVYIPLSSGNLRKSKVIVNRHFYRKVYLFIRRILRFLVSSNYSKSAILACPKRHIVI